MNAENIISSPVKGEAGRGMGEKTGDPQACHRQFAPSPPQPSP